MNANQEAKLKMYRATENYCGENAAIISTNIGFQTAFVQFKTNVASIVSLVQADSVPITGITVDKNMMKKAVCEKTAELAAVIYAYAATIGNNTLKAEVDLPISALARLREDALAPRCRSVLETAQANLAELADYGVTPPMLAALQTAISAYSAETPKPRTAIAERKTMNANLVALFDETDLILKDRMDRLVQIFKTAHPDFVLTYEQTRRIFKPPHTTTQLKVCVTDKATDSPIKNASVTAAPNDSDDPPVTAPTDAAGEVHFKPTPYGLYTVTVTANGYITYENDDFDVKLGEVNSLDVELLK